MSVSLLAPTAISANGTSTPVLVFNTHELSVLNNVSAVPTGGTPTLNFYLQYSDDNGTTWQDMASATQVTTSTIKSYFNISGYAAGPTSQVAASDAALTAGMVVQGPFGDLLRVKWVFVAGGSTGSYTLAVTATTKG